jgi:hypothetical protein
MATPRKLDFPDVTDPNFDPDVPFEADNGLNYKWNGNAWEVVCGAGTETDGFLLKYGHIIDDADARADYDWNEGVKLSTNMGGTNLTLEGSDAVLQGSTSANISAANGDITLEALSGAERINRTIDDTNIDDQIVNKRYVDEKNAFLQGEIVELEEEIEAIAPSVERGFWTMNLLGTVANQGQMSLYDDDYTNVGNPTGLFKDVKSIWLNERDNAGTSHGFAGVEAGELIELFVQGADEYGLYEVVDIHDETNGAAQWWVIEVTFVRTLEDTSTTGTGDIIRVKIFNAPEGGSADEFVLKEGDDMTGRLRMDTGTAGFDTDYRKPTDRNTAFIQLKHLANTSTKLASIWQPQATEEIALGRSVHIESILYCNAWYGYVLNDAADGSGRRERTTQDPNIQFLSFNGDDRGRLKWGSDDRINWTEAGGSLFSDNNQVKLSWSSDRVEILKPVAHNVNATGFKIRGTRPLLPGGSDVFDNNGDIFRVKHVNNEADFIEYLGQIKDSACLVNKGYVDDAVSNATGSALVDVRTDNPSNADIGHMWYNKSTNQLLLRIS